MKKIVFFLILIFTACKIEVQVEENINKSLEQVWCTDIPKDIQTYQADLHFLYKNNLYFFKKGIKTITLYQVDLNSRNLKVIDINLNSIGLNNNTSNIFDIKYQAGKIYFSSQLNFICYDIVTQKLGLLSKNVLEYEFGEQENLIYLVKRNDFNDEKEFGIFNVQNTTYESIIKLNKDFGIENFCVFKNEKGEKFAFLNASGKYLLYEFKSKKITYEKTEIYEIHDVNWKMEYKPPFAYALNSKFYKIDMRTGNIDWSFAESNTYRVSFDEKNSLVYYLESFEKLFCINSETGKTVWESNFNVNPHDSYNVSRSITLVSLNGFLYASNREKMLVFDAKTGKEIQRQTENYSIGYPSIVDEKNGLIYTFKDGSLCALKGLK
jgi:outer membrane protein assembly factor BamB